MSLEVLCLLSLFCVSTVFVVVVGELSCSVLLFPLPGLDSGAKGDSASAKHFQILASLRAKLSTRDNIMGC